MAFFNIPFALEIGFVEVAPHLRLSADCGRQSNSMK